MIKKNAQVFDKYIDHQRLILISVRATLKKMFQSLENFPEKHSWYSEKQSPRDVLQKFKTPVAASDSIFFSSTNKSIINSHCVKSVCIRCYSGPYFPAFGLNKERYEYISVFSPNAGKYGPE